MKCLKILLVFGFLSLTVFAQSSQPDKILKLKLCELTTDPIKYHSKKIQLEATYITWIETTEIGVNESCGNEQMSRIGVQFDKSWKEATRKKIQKKFDKYLNNKFLKDGSRRVNFVSTGYFYCSSKELFENRFSCYFNILKIDSVTKNK